MNKTVLLAASAVLALTAGAAMAAQPMVASPTIAHKTQPVLGAGVLYSQNSNFGYGIDSQNFSSTDQAYDTAGADDFLVPKGKTWKVTGVDVTGVYYNGSGPATSENVTFYSDAKGKPGKVKKALTSLSCTDTAGSFACKTSGVKLKGGTKGTRYWVSVVANCNFSGCGQWGWVENKTIQNDSAMWENPNGGFGTPCTTWGVNATCLGSSVYAGDYAFDLKGKQK